MEFIPGSLWSVRLIFVHWPAGSWWSLIVPPSCTRNMEFLNHKNARVVEVFWLLTNKAEAKTKYTPIICFGDKVAVTDCSCKSTSKEKRIVIIPFLVTQFFQLRIMFNAKSGTLLHQSTECVTRKCYLCRFINYSL